MYNGSRNGKPNKGRDAHLSSLLLKIIAYVTMTVDHIGFSPHQDLLRTVGRLALPIFCFLIAQGGRHTRSVGKYALRLLAFALISEIPFNYFVTGKLFAPASQNIMWTLLLGLLCLAARRWYKDKCPRFASYLTALTVLAACILSMIGKTDYSYMGVMLVVIFDLFPGENAGSKVGMVLSCVALFAWRFVSFAVYEAILMRGFNLAALPLVGGFFLTRVTDWEYTKLFALASLGFLLLYSGKKGSLGSKTADRVASALFYWYYPVHLVIIALLDRL